MFYYDTPRYSVALNAKVASSSMARAIIHQFQPRQDWLIRTAAFPAGVTADDRQWHWMASGKRTPDKPVVLFVRDPVDRFISACQQTHIITKDIYKAIDSLINNSTFIRSCPENISEEQCQKNRTIMINRQAKRRLSRLNLSKNNNPPNSLRSDIHFFHQHEYAVGPTHCFQFPRDIDPGTRFIGIETPLPVSNVAKREKPILTPEQEKIIRDYYAKDQILFNLITYPGYVYNPL